MIIKLTDNTCDGLMEITRTAPEECKITLMIPGEAWITWALSNKAMQQLAEHIRAT